MSINTWILKKTVGFRYGAVALSLYPTYKGFSLFNVGRPFRVAVFIVVKMQGFSLALLFCHRIDLHYTVDDA